MNEEERNLTIMFRAGYLNEFGMKRFIGYLLGEIKDYSEDIKKCFEEKGLTEEAPEIRNIRKGLNRLSKLH